MSMAIPSSKPFSAFAAILLALSLLFLTLNKASSLSISGSLDFNYPSFEPKNANHFILQGDAQLTPGGTVQLTKHSSPSWNTGRVLYATPFRLWDEKTGQHATFHTNFTFILRNIKGSSPADGIAFFMVPPEHSEIPRNSTGAMLGVYSADGIPNQVVAAEFDSYINEEFDPDYQHIGINVNSVRSLKTVEWERESDSIYTVKIRYDSTAKVFSILLAHPDGRFSMVSQIIDLSSVLPETVLMGISATTSSQGELHDILSWAFFSKNMHGKCSSHATIAKKENPLFAFARFA